jgi:4-hydroxy-4-methyl-2-oxoglutarate aldolase
LATPAIETVPNDTAARAREKNEEAKRSRLAAGELGIDIYQMREMLAAKGLRYE